MKLIGLERVELFHDVEVLRRVAAIVTIDFRETGLFRAQAHASIQRKRAAAMQHGAFAIADEREGSAEQGDRITYDMFDRAVVLTLQAGRV